MKIIAAIKNKFKRKQPIYGARIFEQQAWLDRQVQDAMFKRSFDLGLNNKCLDNKYPAK